MRASQNMHTQIWEGDAWIFHASRHYRRQDLYATELQKARGLLTSRRVKKSQSEARDVPWNLRRSFPTRFLYFSYFSTTPFGIW